MFQCSDGDNWGTDNQKVKVYIDKLKEICQFIGYCEVEPQSEKIKWLSENSSLLNVYESIHAPNVKQARIATNSDIWPAFKEFFGGVS